MLNTFGSDKAIPAVGFGFGDAVIMELLESKKLLPDFSVYRKIDDMICAMDEASYDHAVQFGTKLRNSGRSVEIVLTDMKLKRLFQKADRLQAGPIRINIINFSLIVF